VEAEAEARYSFVKKKASEPWLWLAMDRSARHIIAFHERLVETRSGTTGQAKACASLAQ
jgi:IS1 family transposase